jgi:hypothetical protein
MVGELDGEFGEPRKNKIKISLTKAQRHKERINNKKTSHGAHGEHGEK